MAKAARFGLIFSLALLVSAKSHHDDPEFVSKFGPWSSWKTEPELDSTILQVTHGRNDPSLVSPGFYTFTLGTFDEDGHDWGPQIFDNDLNLVFMRRPKSDFATQDLGPCDWKGLPGHLCGATVAERMPGMVGGTEKVVYDETYTQVSPSYGAVGGLVGPDGHEYNMLPGGDTFLQIVYEPRQLDLSAFAGPEKGWVHDACFQEVDVRTKKALFSWCYLDNLPLWETYIFPTANTVNLTSGIAGKGTNESKWDFLHINAADKNSEGDYLISARHLDQLLKIAGNDNCHGVEPGSIIWRLGGKHSDFKMNDAFFSRQHHARYMETNATDTVITLFDNSWEGANDPAHNASAGRIIAVNNQTMEARLLREYIHPDRTLSKAQGAIEIMPNKNAFVAWGWQPQFSEFTENGTLIFHANLTSGTSLFAYRVHKMDWVAHPTWSPKIVAYSQTCTRSAKSPLVAYVSWNGATEVKSYKFAVSIDNESGPWVPAGSFPKDGFETQVTLLTGLLTKRIPFTRYVSVEALDSFGNTLGKASTEIFVPMKSKSLSCNETECFEPPRFHYNDKFNSAESCPTGSLTLAPVMLLLLVVAIEYFVYMYNRMIQASTWQYSRVSTGLDIASGEPVTERKRKPSHNPV